MEKKKLPTLSDSDIVTSEGSKPVVKSSVSNLSTIAIALALTTGAAAMSMGCRAIRSDYSDCDGDYTSTSDVSDTYIDTSTYADSKPCD